VRDEENRLLSLVDGRTRLASSNRMELLLFRLSGPETYGLNVFKVCEVCVTPPITRAPHTPPGVEGMISLRGTIIPIINLGYFLDRPVTDPTKLIITEFSGHIQGLMVQDVDRIVRVGWDEVKAPSAVFGHGANLVTAITELPDGKLVSILDVEQVLHDAIGDDSSVAIEALSAGAERAVFFADDSPLARKRIASVLDSLGVVHTHACDGRQAWEKLQAMAETATKESVALRDRLGAILVDAEMPELDGYMLTRSIKADARFKGIPVVMHSSLSSIANRTMGEQAGVDAYVAKFDPKLLASTLRGFLQVLKAA
jgi:two-component system chemotaxis response regulator CheV